LDLTSNFDETILKNIEKAWKLELNTQSSSTLIRNRELASISRSDLILFNSDFDKYVLSNYCASLPPSFILPTPQESSVPTSISSVLSSPIPYTPFRRGSLQLIGNFTSSSWPSEYASAELTNLCLFLNHVWPIVSAADDRIRLDVMDISDSALPTNMINQPNKSIEDPKPKHRSILDICEGIPGVRVVSVGI
jgi:hypothetical protein